MSVAPGMPSLVAVVLNWNGGEDTVRALDSLSGIETICVDNGSTDGSAEEVERRFPEVELVRTGTNLGFAGRRVGWGGPDRFHELRDVERADGAAMAVSRTALDRVGLLDETLFAYVEDVDWSLRIRRAGFALVLVPDARVRHRGSASTGGGASTANLYYDTRNTIAVVERHRPLPRGLRGLRRGAVVGAHLLQAARHPSPRPASRAVLAGWRDARSGRLGQMSSR